MVSRQELLKKGDLLEPKLFSRILPPKRFGTIVPDDSWDGFKFVETEEKSELFKEDQIWLDFGEHCTGYISFNVDALKYPDAPIRLHIKFAETLLEMGRSFSECKSRMNHAWLQEETVTLDEPMSVSLPRRYAFRYARITVQNTNVPININDIKVTAYSSADYSKLKPGPKDARLAQLDRVGVTTLAECMQRGLEDGPKRDRRMWIGDIRIQALVNYETFDNLDIVKRCLYYFAGYTGVGKKTPRDMYINSKGTYCHGNAFVDYSLMFNLTLCEYYEHTNDSHFVDDLFDVADEQIKLACAEVGEDGIVEFRPVGNLWAFIDHCPPLNKVVSMQGVIIYTLHKMIELAKNTGRLEKADEYIKIAEKMEKASVELLYNKEKGAFISKYDDFQYSVHAQAWMVLANVLSPEENKRVIKNLLESTDENMVRPVSPYAQHTLLEAIFAAGMKEEAIDFMESYWGKMVDLGADTYWEVFVPGDPEASPYKDPLMNSACHAWSCSPSYFIRKFL